MGAREHAAQAGYMVLVFKVEVGVRGAGRFGVGEFFRGLHPGRGVRRGLLGVRGGVGGGRRV